MTETDSPSETSKNQVSQEKFNRLRLCSPDATINPMLKVYIYQKCSTCRNAIKWLNEQKIAHAPYPIRETPPSTNELKTALRAFDGQIRILFNTSGMDYRELGLKDKLPTMSEADAIKLLSSNGNLVKRPFVIGDGKALVGFKVDQWQAELLG